MALTRREVLLAAAAAAGLGPDSAREALAQRGRFRIGACDWSLGMRGRTDAFSVGRQLGLDGIQVSMGGVDNDLQLRRPEVQRAYREASAATGVQIGGVALDVMNQVPYKSDPRTEQWVSDSVDVAHALGVRVILLAFFEKGDLRGDPDGQAEVVRRLKGVAPRAEKNGVVLGIESWLSATDLLRILDEVRSPSIRVYYDLANSTQMGYDILAEIRQLGRERICEFHAKENGALLGQGRIDFPAVRKVLDDIDFTGWLQIEGAVPKGGQIVASYEHNVRFMRTHFS